MHVENRLFDRAVENPPDLSTIFLTAQTLANSGDLLLFHSFFPYDYFF